EFDLSRYAALIGRMEPIHAEGEVVEQVGLLIESRGPAAAIGDFCRILTRSGRAIRTQVVGFRNGRVLSIPLEETGGLSLGDTIQCCGGEGEIPVSDGLLGRVIDGFGRPVDGLGPIDASAT